MLRVTKESAKYGSSARPSRGRVLLVVVVLIIVLWTVTALLVPGRGISRPPLATAIHGVPTLMIEEKHPLKTTAAVILLPVEVSTAAPPPSLESLLALVAEDIIVLAEDRQAAMQQARANLIAKDERLSKRHLEPLTITIVCECGIPSGGNSSAQSLCEETMAAIGSGSVKSLVLNRNRKNRQSSFSEAETKGDGKKQLAGQQPHIDDAEQSGLPIDLQLPFWGTTSKELRVKIAKHANKMISLANTHSMAGKLTLPALRDGSSLRYGGGKGGTVAPAALLHYFGLGASQSLRQEQGGNGGAEDSSCSVPSLEKLMFESPLVPSPEGAPVFLTPSQRKGIRVDFTIVCGGAFADRAKQANLGGEAVALLVQRLLAQSSHTYLLDIRSEGGHNDEEAQSKVESLVAMVEDKDNARNGRYQSQCVTRHLGEVGQCLRASCGADSSPASRIAECQAHSGGSATASLPPDCTRVANPLDGVTINKVLKFGTKTGIYAGHYRGSGEEGVGSESNGDTEGQPVVVKHFAGLQYSNFLGFSAFMRWTAPYRMPLIVSPVSVCYEPQSHTVFQLQHHVQKSSNLKKIMKKEGAGLPMANRLQMAIQIVCIFDFLHTKHPSGHVFSFDDNHPEQYIITKNERYHLPPKQKTEKGDENKADHNQKEDGDGDGYFHGTFYELRMIDIDTLQLAVGGTTPTNLTSYQTKCRCFFCKGRSNCMFVNTLEGYAGCGQTADNEASGDSESAVGPPKALDGKVAPTGPLLCNPSSDMWFLAQLLYFMAEGQVPYDGLSMREVIQKITLKEYPVPATEDATYNALVKEMFMNRPSEEHVLGTLFSLCDKYSCGMTECPALVTDPHPYHDIADLSRLQDQPH